MKTLESPGQSCGSRHEKQTQNGACTHIAADTVKSRLERGRALLRRLLEQRGFGLPAVFLVLGLTGGNVRVSLRAKALGSASLAVAALVPASGASLTSKFALTALSLGMIAVCLSFPCSAEERLLEVFERRRGLLWRHGGRGAEVIRQPRQRSGWFSRIRSCPAPSMTSPQPKTEPPQVRRDEVREKSHDQSAMLAALRKARQRSSERLD